MGQYGIVSRKIDSFRELENLVNLEQIIFCDEIQNTFLLLEFYHKERMGIAYYDYGVPLDFKFLDSNKRVYLGLGINFIYIDMCKNEVIFNHRLHSVFYELLIANNRKYICVVCELDVYCYSVQGKRWSQGFKNIINNFYIVDDANVLIKCDDNTEYLFSLENGEILDWEWGCHEYVISGLLGSDADDVVELEMVVQPIYRKQVWDIQQIIYAENGFAGLTGSGSGCNNVIRAFSREYSNIVIDLVSGTGKVYTVKNGLY